MTLIDRFPPRNIADADDIGSNPTTSRPFVEVIEARISRRDMLKGLTAGTALGLFAGTMTSRFALAGDARSTLTFEEIEHGVDETIHVPKGYNANVLIRWGDPVVKDAPEFDPNNLSATAQEKQFGYNCDYIAYMPIPLGSSNSEHGLLFVNHEYTSGELMFPGLTQDDTMEKITAEQAKVEMAAHGASVIEVRLEGGQWQVVPGSEYARRISLATTKIAVSGPAAGHDRLKTSADPSGKLVIGTANNCAGGYTPWGTALTAEENFNGYFGGKAEELPQAATYKRYGISSESWYAWWKHEARFNVEKEPNEPNRFGWVVEVDPYDRNSTPVKRTALGRFKHENAHCIVNKDGHVVVYMGDDERFEYIYKFVTKGTYNPNDRAANMNLLDEGTLYVAKFADDGSMTWLPLIHGHGPLTEANGFASQADIVIEARRAADLMGATPMDRPEWVVPNPVNGRVYAMLTNNSKRTLDRIDAVNPRADNTTGHIVEMIPPGQAKDTDHAATEGKWEIFLIAGDPTWGTTQYGKGTSKNGWLACPDGCNFDAKGRLWIATDQGGAQGKFKIGDGIWATDVDGEGRAVTRYFMRLPRGAETCGVAFTPDSSTLFVSVQHPAEEKDSTFDKPSTRWPDFNQAIPPRPSVVAVRKEDGGEIGV